MEDQFAYLLDLIRLGLVLISWLKVQDFFNALFPKNMVTATNSKCKPKGFQQSTEF
jgi:hypothetical protein